MLLQDVFALTVVPVDLKAALRRRCGSTGHFDAAS
jgi:hypothetical protein